MNARVDGISPNGIFLNWDTNGAQRTVYFVYRRNLRVGATSGNSFRDFGLEPDSDYCYDISSVDAQGHESPKSPLGCARTTPKDSVAKSR
jgi:hypothetical protein